ncbi:MAG: DNA polymerase, partial [Nitrososphaera sp.]|nr:DNA polymerase [Nitrososphaera sp.]
MQIETIRDAKRLARFERWLRSHPDRCVGLDTETFGPTKEWTTRNIVDELTCRIGQVSMAIGDIAVVIIASHQNEEHVPHEALVEFLWKLTTMEKRFCIHNADYDLQALKNEMGDFPRFHKLADTMYASRLVNLGVVEKGRLSHALKPMARALLGLDLVDYDAVMSYRLISGPTDDDLISEFINRARNFLPLPYPENIADTLKNMRNALCSALAPIRGPGKISATTLAPMLKEALGGTYRPWKRKVLDGLSSAMVSEMATRTYRQLQCDEEQTENTIKYAALDAWAALKLWEQIFPKLKDTAYMEHFDKVGMPFLYTIREMHENGAKVDMEYINQSAEVLAPGTTKAAKTWLEITGVEITRTAECADVIYNRLKAWPIDENTPRTASGALAFNKTAFSYAATKVEPGSIGERLIHLKKAHAIGYKILTTYTDSMLEQMPYRKDGHIRTQYMIDAVETYRLSSRGPNLQNIPREIAPDMPNLRKAFIAADGCLLTVGDWKQLEVFILAHLSHDERLTEYLSAGVDMHARNAELLKVPRVLAKNVFFGWIYGGREHGLASQVRLPVAVVAPVVTGFDDLFPGVIEFRKTMAAFAREHGYVETLDGRRRWLPKIHSIREFDKNPEAFFEKARKKLDTSPHYRAKLAAKGISLDSQKA